MHLKNPTKSVELFYNKSIYFWSPWDGPLANGTMARNPWLTISPIRDIGQSSVEGNQLVNGGIGKLISWLWFLGGLGFLIYGSVILWNRGSIERLLASLGLIVILVNWAISLMTIGDHRFRIPVMGLSLFLQAIGLKTLLRGGKPVMVDGPTLR